MSHGILKETQQKASQLTNDDSDNATTSCLYQPIAYNPQPIKLHKSIVQSIGIRKYYSHAKLRKLIIQNQTSKMKIKNKKFASDKPWFSCEAKVDSSGRCVRTSDSTFYNLLNMVH